ncbi:hypothetical protein [Streptomyces sp. NPDC046385]|uniref:DUF7336 domain-containing protein n=1 Tax=unclassified Streptomyces TaxID=2593676 RepID=UPI003404B47F
MAGQGSVYLLWHVHHSNEEGAEPRHFAEPGDFWADEEAGDDVKLLGTYSSREVAEIRVRKARDLPGFRDEPDCFYVEEFEIDKDEWTEGYVTD